MKRLPLDTFDEFPREMKSYLRNYGWHFNRKACDLACRQMKRRGSSNERNEKLDPWSKDDVDELLKRNNVTLENNAGYDYVFAANMCKADFLGSSVPDEQHAALYVKDVIDDPDAGDGTTFRRWYASMIASGIPVEWDEII